MSSQCLRSGSCRCCKGEESKGGVRDDSLEWGTPFPGWSEKEAWGDDTWKGLNKAWRWVMKDHSRQRQWKRPPGGSMLYWGSATVRSEEWQGPEWQEGTFFLGGYICGLQGELQALKWEGSWRASKEVNVIVQVGKLIVVCTIEMIVDIGGSRIWWWTGCQIR